MMSDDQLNARVEAMVPGLVQVLKTKGAAAAEEALREHLHAFRGAVTKAVQDDNAKFVEQIQKWIDEVDDAPDRAVALEELGAKVLFLLGEATAEGDVVSAVQR